MKPYGRKNEPIKGGNTWKIDYHLHTKKRKKNRKLMGRYV